MILKGVTTQLKEFSAVGAILAAGFIACMWLLTHFASADEVKAQENRVTTLEHAEALTSSRLGDLKEQVKEIAKTVGARITKE